MAMALVVFAIVYVGMILGHLPRLALDRTGIALLGAIALLATGETTLAQAGASIDVPTLALLFGLMLVSAQLQLGGFYGCVASRLAAAALSPSALLGALVAVTGLLAAIFTNDVVCLAMTPVWIDACALAGNLLLVGSIANLIVADAATRRGIALDWRLHARTGIPVTVVTLAIAAASLAWIGR